MFPEHLLSRRRFQSSRVARVTVVEFVLQLLSRQHDLFGIDNDHEISGIKMGAEDRLVLAPEEDSHLSGQSPKHASRCVEQMPTLIDFVDGSMNRFRHEGHFSSRQTSKKTY